jgi:hypothetical protein
MLAWNRNTFLLLMALCCIATPALAEPLPPLDLDRLEGKWSIDEKGDPEQFLAVAHERESNRVVQSKIRLKIGGHEGYVDYIGPARFEATTGNPHMVLFPVAASLVGLPESMEYRVDGDRLLLSVDEGKYKGTYTFQRVKKN